MTKYKCSTLGDCDRANAGEIFERAPGEDLKCPGCGMLLDPTVAATDASRRNRLPLVAAGLVAVAVVAIGGYMYTRSPAVESRQVVFAEPAVPVVFAPASVPATPGDAGTAGIAPSDAETKALRVQSDASLVAGNPADAESASSKAASNELLKMAIAKMAQGKLDDAERDLAEAQLRSPKQPLIHYNKAVLRLMQNRTDDALKEFEASFKGGFAHFDKMDQDTDLDGLRKNPRFTELVKQYRTQVK